MPLKKIYFTLYFHTVIIVHIELSKYERIRNLRLENNITQTEIAKYLNVKQNTYSQYEIGILNYPLDIIIRLAIYYQTSIDYLVGLTDNKNPYPKSKDYNNIIS